MAPEDLDLLRVEHSAAMVTVGNDGRPKVARCGVALVDGQLWSSGKQDRVRTRRLRRDPRCTLYVHASSPAWRGLETTVTLLEGPEAPELNLRLFRVMQDRPSGPLWWYGQDLDQTAFLEQMRSEQRVIYQFEVERSYGPRL
jgi:Pyridoxamine 5'-phosphate oxidase